MSEVTTDTGAGHPDHHAAVQHPNRPGPLPKFEGPDDWRRAAERATDADSRAKPLLNEVRPASRTS